jgi:biopolymer transport protein ExbD
MFLLATAVWNQLAAVNANQQVPGQASTEDAPPEDEKVKLILQVRNSGYVLGSSAGESIDISKRAVADQKEFDVDELQTKLAQWKQAWDKRDDLIVAPEDGVRYEDVIVAMDVAAAAGFTTLSMADGAAFL